MKLYSLRWVTVIIHCYTRTTYIYILIYTHRELTKVKGPMKMYNFLLRVDLTGISDAINGYESIVAILNCVRRFMFNNVCIY